MVAYIKDRKTFGTKHYADAIYDATLQSIYDEVTTIEMRGSPEQVERGDFVFVDGFSGIISEIDVDRDKLILTCDDIVKVFRRDLFPVTDSAQNGVEAFIKRQIDANYKNIADM